MPKYLALGDGILSRKRSSRPEAVFTYSERKRGAVEQKIQLNRRKPQVFNLSVFKVDIIKKEELKLINSSLFFCSVMPKYLAPKRIT